ncbi:MAG TPA: acryloyl-CoA reductase [Steroidobacteraceae bacterium]|nr:acryloyl-CoA reductase [Steroidobacteraceae bacterium]
MIASTFRSYLIVRDDRGVSSSFVDRTQDDMDPGEVVIRNRYASINYKDALAATGKGKIVRRFPCVGGIDAAGVVETSTDSRFEPGDEVIVHGKGLGVSHHGGYSPWLRVPADWTVRLPGELSLLEAITVGVAGYTAALAVDLMELNGLAPKGKVLVNGATGGVASISIDLLAQRGFEVVALTSKPGERDYLLSLGAIEVLSTKEIQMGARPLESSMWAGAVDSLGGEPLAWLTRTMQPEGVIASIGNAAGIDLHTTVMPFILRGVRLIGVNSDNSPATTRRIWQRLATDLRPSHLRSIARVIPFDELPQAIDAVIAGRIKGRTVVQID